MNEDIDIQVTPEDTCMSVPDNTATSFTREASTQCCFDRSYVITANASTQTENVSDNAKVENNCLPTEKLDCNNLWLLKHDHPYAKSKVDHDTSSPQKPGPPLYASDEGNEKEEEDIDVDFEDNDSDMHFFMTSSHPHKPTLTQKLLRTIMLKKRSIWFSTPVCHGCSSTV